MKLILQIALGVFLGTLASGLSLDAWRTRQAQVAKEAAYKLKSEQEERIRSLFMQGRQGEASKTNNPPQGFVPEDVQQETIKNPTPHTTP